TDESKGQDSQNEGSFKTAERGKIDYTKVIVELLAQAGNIQDIGKRLAGKFGGEAGQYRLKIKDVLAKMVKLDEIGAERTDFVKFNEVKAYV
ncbi:hypothetical protein B1A_06131, partial [mine drainage metagenome]